MPRRNKYGAKKVTIDGHRFDSKAEAARYVQLRAMKRTGEITNLELQPRYKFESGITYLADFAYHDQVNYSDPEPVIEDVKGMETATFRLKKKLMRHEYGIDVQVVKMDSKTVNQLLALGGMMRGKKGRD